MSHAFNGSWVRLNDEIPSSCGLVKTKTVQSQNTSLRIGQVRPTGCTEPYWTLPLTASVHTGGIIDKYRMYAYVAKHWGTRTSMCYHPLAHGAFLAWYKKILIHWNLKLSCGIGFLIEDCIFFLIHNTDEVLWRWRLYSQMLISEIIYQRVCKCR